MSGLFETLQVLRSFLDCLNPKWEERIINRFREVFLRRFEEAKIDYCRKALEGHYLPDARIGELLGYSSAAAAADIRNAKISTEKFDLLQGTVGAHIKFPTAIERRIATFVETVDFVRRELMKQTPAVAFDRKIYHFVEQTFAEDMTACELEMEGDERGWLKYLLKRVRSVVSAENVEQPDDLPKLLREWGPAYLTTKNALANLVREAPKPHDS